MQRSITAVATATPRRRLGAAWCIGGGVDLISAVDIRYASADAKFSVREVKLSIVADVGSLARLPHPVRRPPARAGADGWDIDAARAEKIGLVNDVFADADAALAAAHVPPPPGSPRTPRWWCTASGTSSTSSAPPDVAASLRYVGGLELRLPAVAGPR